MKRITLLLLILLMAPSLADDRLRASELRSMGMDMFTFQPIAFSHDGRLLAGLDKAPFERKKEGFFFRLWLIPVTSDARFGEVRKVELPISSFEQGCFTPDDSGFLIISKARTVFTLVDTASLEYKNLMEPQPGTPGFRAEPAVLWTAAGKLLVTGTPYDENKYINSRYIASIDWTQEGAAAFNPVVDVHKLESSVKRMHHVNYHSTELGFFSQKTKEETVLSVWEGGDTLREIDRAPRYHGFWGSGTRFLLSAQRGEDQHELAIYDADLGQMFSLEKGASPFSYLFLSKDGTTGIACHIDQKSGKMDVFYTRGTEGPVMPVTKFKDARVGWLRVSTSGKVLVLFNQLGLEAVTLE